MTSAKNTSEGSMQFQTITFGIGHVVLLFRGFLSLFILSRLLNAKDFGILGALNTFSNLMASILLMGVGSSNRMLTPALEKSQREEQFWGLVQFVALIAGVVVMALWSAYRPIQNAVLVSDVTRKAYRLGLFLIPLSIFENLFQSQMTNNRQGRQFAQIVSISVGCELAGAAAGAYLFGVLGVLGGIIITKTIVVSWLAAAIMKMERFVPLNRRILNELGKYYRYGFQIFVAGLSSWVISNSDRFIIGRQLGSAQLGFYYIASNVCSPMHRVASPIYMALMPFLVHSLAASDNEKMQHYLKSSFQLLLILFCPMVLFLTVNARDLLHLVVTEELSRGWVIIPFVSAGILFLQVGGVYNYNLVAHKKVHLTLVSTFAGAVVNMTLNLLLIPRIGIVAAGLATMCAYGTTVIIDMYFSQKLQPLHIGKKAWFQLILCLSAMAIVTAASRKATADLNLFVRLAITGTLASLTYAGGILHFNLLTKEFLPSLSSHIKLLFEKK